MISRTSLRRILITMSRLVTFLRRALYREAKKTQNRRTVKLEGLAPRQLLAADITQLGSFNSFIDDTIELNGITYFTTNSELWATNGTSTGTQLVLDFGNAPGETSDIELGVLNSELAVHLTDYNNSLFQVTGASLFKSDGTASGTVLVRDFGNLSYFGSAEVEFVELNGSLYFSQLDSNIGSELWKTDLTASGTVSITEDFNPGASAGSYPENLTEHNGELYFSASDATRGDELWKTDGTVSGTVIVKEVNTNVGSAASSFPRGLTSFNGDLYFFAEREFGDAELWKTDGTESGSAMVFDFPASSFFFGHTENKPVEAGGNLIFSLSDDVSGNELWKTDGTASGTAMIADLIPGVVGSYPDRFLEHEGEVYFQASDTSFTGQLWKTDGTGSGTVLLSQGISGSITSVEEFEGEIYFSATGNAEFYKLDSSTAGLTPLLSAGAVAQDVEILGVNNGALNFTTGSPFSTLELFSLTNNPIAHEFRSDDFAVSGSWNYGFTAPQYIDSASGTFSLDGVISYDDPTDGIISLSGISPNGFFGSGADQAGNPLQPCSSYTVEHFGSATFSDLNGTVSGGFGSPTGSSYPTYNDLTGGSCPAGSALGTSPFANTSLLEGTYNEENNATLAFNGTATLQGGTATFSTPALPLIFDDTTPTDLVVAAQNNNSEIVVSVIGKHINSNGNRAAAVTAIESFYSDANGQALGSPKPFDDIDLYWNSKEVTIDLSNLEIPPSAASMTFVIDNAGAIPESDETNNSVTISFSVAAPTGLTSVLNANNTATLNWNAVSDATDYEIYRWNDATNAAELLATTGNASPTFTTTPLTPGTRNWHYVVAKSGSVSSAPSAWASQDVPLETPANFAVSLGANSTGVLNWDAVEGATAYEIFAWNAATNSADLLTTVNSSAAAGSPLSFNSAPLSSGTQWFYVRAITDVVVSPRTDWLSVNVTLSTPTNFQVTQNAQSNAVLSWDDVSGETGYEVYVWNYDTLTADLIATVPASTTQYTTSTSYALESTQWFYVRAIDASGASPRTDWRHVKFFITTPTNFAVTQTVQNQALLTWSNVGGESGYEIFWWNANTSQTISLGTVPADSTSFTTTDTYASGETQWFYIRALNGAQTPSLRTAWRHVNFYFQTPTNFVATPSSGGNALLSWDDVAAETGYRIFIWDYATSSQQLFATVPANQASLLATGFLDGTRQWFKIEAFNDSETSLRSAWIFVDIFV